MHIEPKFRRDADGLSGWRCDFHIHTAEDPKDHVAHTSVDLVERAAQLGFSAVAITLHEGAFPLEAAQARAEELGLCLIPGIELTLEQKHLLALGLPPEVARSIGSIADLRAVRREYGDSLFLIAPHPFYVVAHSMNHRFGDWVDLFDAVEVTRLQTQWISRNGPALRAAKQHGLPIVCNSDTHHLRHFGRHFSVVEGAETPTPQSIFSGIRRGAVTAVCPSLSTPAFIRELFDIFFLHPYQKIRSPKPPVVYDG